MTDPAAARPAWATGDATGLPLPVHGEALSEGGTEWLTEASGRSGHWRAITG